ncbi:Hypothetical protein DEACI_2048 [Acididesulfobacillus acetoxydans]|uniref:Uncharacterized protein n=1 Tax=Acididesulfobacillus acetoxydans TaxID=1561005 RepID=A0A8S0WFV5_9FIRM|nr:Hypothetical protein DEACI_2048 [Acididesulfobacillus acetoxydans]CEJ07457.1 Hypothetical protein DEACI_1923 [Acididesulfobacillus acetoxydans]
MIGYHMFETNLDLYPKAFVQISFPPLAVRQNGCQLLFEAGFYTIFTGVTSGGSRPTENLCLGHGTQSTL